MSRSKTTATTKKNTGGSAKGSAKGQGAKKKTGTAAKRETKNKGKINNGVKNEILGITLLALGVLLLISLQFSAAGRMGELVSLLLKGCFSGVAYVLPYFLIIYSILMFTGKAAKTSLASVIYVICTILSVSVLYSIGQIDVEGMKFSVAWFGETYQNGIVIEGGGTIGMSLALILVKLIGKAGAYVFTVAFLAIISLLVVNKPLLLLFEKMAEHKREKELIRISEEEEAELYQQNAEYARNTQVVAMTQTSMSSSSDMRKKKNILSYFSKKDDEMFGKSGLEPAAGIEAHEESEANRQAVNPAGQAENVQASNMHDHRPSQVMIENNEGIPTIEIVPAAETLPSMPGALVASMGSLMQQETLPTDEKNNDFDIFRELEAMDEEPTGDGPMEDASTNLASELAQPDLVHTEPPQPIEPVLQPPTVESEPSIPPWESKPVTPWENKPVTVAIAPQEALKIEASKPLVDYKFPPITYLKRSAAAASGGDRVALAEKASLLEQTLQSFNVNAKVVQVSQGPAVTRYEIQPSVGVKVSSIVRLADDIALNLKAKSIRLEAPIPGKAAVGIEVENDRVSPVTIGDIIDSTEFKEAKSKITFAVGKDISGNAIVANLKEMPHLLIAGSTGSGKSVCINSIITSLLYKATPDEVKLILIDPKVVELSNYNGIPHLLIPVVNEPSKAAVALNWAVSEMDVRYKKFAEESVRDLASYNDRVKKDGRETIPQIVIVIDELADLMMTAPTQVEESICRLAQKARAAGMHLIVATQRPSVDVITGVIKANIPSRIAFAVSSQVDSRTILDMAGAEKLVGKGDMLFSPIGLGKPTRVQGTLIVDEEVENVINFVKAQGHTPEFSNDLIHSMESSKPDFNEEAADEFLKDAIELVVNAEQASVSMLQRRFRIGYNRAARLIDMMEERSIVGPSDGSRPRRVMMSKDEFEGLDNDTQQTNQPQEQEIEDDGVPDELM